MHKRFSTLILPLALLTATTGAQAKGPGHSRGTSTASGAKSTSVEHVSGYTTKRGTYVAPHDKTTPDSTKLNNWSTKGNVNPETGKKGTVDPYKSK